jgi:hypothetical protein
LPQVQPSLPVQPLALPNVPSQVDKEIDSQGVIS